jgi:hypothetical protein
VQPHAVRDQLGPWIWPNITFSGGVPVGGSAYNFTGHFHDSGFPSYNDALVFLVKDNKNVVYRFVHSGHVGGTLGGGSRDDDWNNSGRNEALAAGWQDLLNHWEWRSSAAVGWDWESLLGVVMKGIGFASAVIAIV